MVIDEGNTLVKLAVFRGQELTELTRLRKLSVEDLSKIAAAYPDLYSIMWSSVRVPDQLPAELEELPPQVKIVPLRSGLLLPVKVQYKTPETLGHDRLANACGAHQMYSHENALVVDMGTCIKYDLITADDCYIGGAISPGLNMRYKALSRFTEKLPYLKYLAPEFPELTGQSTEGSIRSGVEQGILAEIDGICQKYMGLYKDLKIILTGGDHERFADKLKSPIFVAPNLTLKGLKAILDHNDI